MQISVAGIDPKQIERYAQYINSYSVEEPKDDETELRKETREFQEVMSILKKR